MSALNLIIGRERAFLLTDSLLYLASGEVTGFARKCEIAPKAKIAVAARGDHRLPLSFALAVDDDYGCIDDLIADAGEGVFWRYSATLQRFNDRLHLDFMQQLAFAGWSQAEGRPMGVSMILGQDESFEVVRDGIASPLPGPAELDQLHALGAEPGEDWMPDTFDPIRHGLPYLEAQRRMIIETRWGDDGNKAHVIGGELTLTTITRDCIDQRVIHSWPDEIGKVIVPEPFVQPAPPAGSRQAQRTTERQAKKLKNRAVLLSFLTNE
ncbi:hypothetical protein [Jiella sp. M17.18]|uniref:hypothetical protein n=1 Tax=Jiella sp. M17.18 TaxID=3234247 RepID=UPI0034DE482F